MLGHVLMALLLGIHDEEYDDLAKDAPERYQSLVSSEEYNTKPLYCPFCDSQNFGRKGTIVARDSKTKCWRWLCKNCKKNWFTKC